MAVEILRDSKVIVKRPDADMLLAIRNGAWTYDQLMTWTEKQEALLNEVARTSKLPEKPDMAKIDALFQAVVEPWLR